MGWGSSSGGMEDVMRAAIPLWVFILILCLYFFWIKKVIVQFYTL